VVLGLDKPVSGRALARNVKLNLELAYEHTCDAYDGVRAAASEHLPLPDQGA
jgi:hypothetical protein